jgi:hypothetical protein
VGILPFGALLWTRALPVWWSGTRSPSALECSPTLLNNVFQAECEGRMSRTAGVIDGRAIWVRITGDCERVDTDADAPAGAAALIVSFAARVWLPEPASTRPMLMPATTATAAAASAIREPRIETPLIPIAFLHA